MRFDGLIFGVISILTIGVWHPLVIKGEYHFGKKVCIPVFFAVGAVCTVGSVFVPNRYASVGLAIFGFFFFCFLTANRRRRRPAAHTS